MAQAMPWVMMNDHEVGIWEGGVFDDDFRRYGS